MNTEPQNRLVKVRSKFSLLKHVKHDPQYDCEHYSKNNTYSHCIKKSLISKFYKLLGCHPPFISRKNGYCTQKFNFTKEDERYKK